MVKPRHDAASRPDEQNPEWTVEDFRNARPTLEVLSEIFGEKAAQAVRRRPGRPAKPDAKINQTLRLDADVVAAYRGLGAGWQVRINRVLRENMPIAESKNSPISSIDSSRDRNGLTFMSTKDGGQLFVERRAQGDYAVRRPGSERASDVLPTQKEAIARARELSPSATPMVERVRNTSTGAPDKWRKP